MRDPATAEGRIGVGAISAQDRLPGQCEREGDRPSTAHLPRATTTGPAPSLGDPLTVGVTHATVVPRGSPGRAPAKRRHTVGRVRARSPSSPEPHAARAAATRSGWPQEGADIIAVDLCAGRRRPCRTRGDDRGRPRRDGQAGRGARPADRRPRGRRPRPRRAAGRASTRASPQLGRLDIVCANAGIGTSAPAMELSRGDWQRHDRRQPDRRLEDGQGRGPAPDRRAAAAARSSSPVRPRAASHSRTSGTTSRPSTAWSG